jgi:hypothetical protein
VHRQQVVEEAIGLVVDRCDDVVHVVAIFPLANTPFVKRTEEAETEPHPIR